MRDFLEVSQVGVASFSEDDTDVKALFTLLKQDALFEPASLPTSATMTDAVVLAKSLTSCTVLPSDEEDCKMSDVVKIKKSNQVGV